MENKIQEMLIDDFVVGDRKICKIENNGELIFYQHINKSTNNILSERGYRISLVNVLKLDQDHDKNYGFLIEILCLGNDGHREFYGDKFYFGDESKLIFHLEEKLQKERINEIKCLMEVCKGIIQNEQI